MHESEALERSREQARGRRASSRRRRYPDRSQPMLSSSRRGLAHTKLHVGEQRLCCSLPRCCARSHSTVQRLGSAGMRFDRPSPSRLHAHASRRMNQQDLCMKMERSPRWRGIAPVPVLQRWCDAHSDVRDLHDSYGGLEITRRGELIHRGYRPSGDFVCGRQVLVDLCCIEQRPRPRRLRRMAMSTTSAPRRAAV
jgi:hypothetical protein